MGRRDPTYSDAQRQAIEPAINEEGASARDVTERTAAGSLADLPPFELPESTAHDITAKERKAPEGLGGEEAQLRSRALLDGGIDQLEVQVAAIAKRQAEADGELQLSDLTRLEKVAQAARELVKLGAVFAEDPHPQTRTPTGNGDRGAPTSSALISEMVRDIDAQRPSDKS